MNSGFGSSTSLPALRKAANRYGQFKADYLYDRTKTGNSLRKAYHKVL
jgi:hypothetical protein